MDDSRQGYANAQIARIDRMLGDYRVFTDAAHNKLGDEPARSARRSWIERMPDWFVAAGLVSGLITLLVAAAPILLDLGRTLAACR